MGAFDYVKYTCTVIKEKCVSCFGCLGNDKLRSRSKSLIMKYSEDDEELSRLYQDAILVARPATEPSDIIWKNMRGSRGLFLLRRMALFILGILIIIFVSSPTVIFANIKAQDKTHFWDFEWINEDLPAGGVVRNHAAPTIIILINLVLLIIIDFVCILEAYETHSLYQEAMFSKSFVYLVLNMLIIPALTLSSSGASSDM